MSSNKPNGAMGSGDIWNQHVTDLSVPHGTKPASEMRAEILKQKEDAEKVQFDHLVELRAKQLLAEQAKRQPQPQFNQAELDKILAVIIKCNGTGMILKKCDVNSIVLELDGVAVKLTK